MLTKSREKSGTDPEGGRLRVTQGVAGAGLAEPHLRTSCSPFTLNGFLSHTKQTAACQLTASLSGGQPHKRGLCPLRKPLRMRPGFLQTAGRHTCSQRGWAAARPTVWPQAPPRPVYCWGPRPLTATSCPGPCSEGTGGSWHAEGLQASRHNQTPSRAQVSGQDVCAVSISTRQVGEPCPQTPCPRV